MRITAASGDFGWKRKKKNLLRQILCWVNQVAVSVYPFNPPEDLNFTD
jgi:hypothetical protein